MLFIAEFGRHADKPEVFKQALEPHLAYLETNKDRVLLSATKYASDSPKAVGFVWIIEADDFDHAQAICQEDPFWQEGLRTSFELYSLTKADPSHSAVI